VNFTGPAWDQIYDILLMGRCSVVCSITGWVSKNFNSIT